MNLENLDDILVDQPAYRIIQAKKAIFKDFISDWNDATIFPKNLREKLNKKIPLTINAQVFISSDNNAVKALISLKDSLNIETVLMRHTESLRDNLLYRARTDKADPRLKDRNTVCASTQIGCPLNCSFCATGRMGFKRNLNMSEIVEQILFFARYLKKKNKHITNIVFMGMGEPFLNYDNVIGAIRYLNQKDTLNIGMRHFSISTSGIPDKIRKFANEDMEVNLALSLHAADDNLRSRLMPINQTHPLKKVLEALDYYQQKMRRKLMFEYIMINGINDSDMDAKKLISIAKRYMCVVNLIPYNSSENLSYKPTPADKIKRFKEVLEKARVDVIQRFSYGRDINAACGQLALKTGARKLEKQ